MRLLCGLLHWLLVLHRLLHWLLVLHWLTLTWHAVSYLLHRLTILVDHLGLLLLLNNDDLRLDRLLRLLGLIRFFALLPPIAYSNSSRDFKSNEADIEETDDVEPHLELFNIVVPVLIFVPASSNNQNEVDENENPNEPYDFKAYENEDKYGRGDSRTRIFLAAAEGYAE